MGTSLIRSFPVSTHEQSSVLVRDGAHLELCDSVTIHDVDCESWTFILHAFSLTPKATPSRFKCKSMLARVFQTRNDLQTAAQTVRQPIAASFQV